MAKTKDITGAVFGRLTVVDGKGAYWSCLCECGNSKTIYRGSLTSGATKSCGCLHRESCSQPPGYMAISHLFSRFRANALSREIDFELSRIDFESIVTQDCYFCGDKAVKFNPYCRKGEAVDRKPGRRSQETIDRAWVLANSIDRLDNAVGYTIANSKPCCVECNMAKGTRSAEKFLAHAKRLINHNNQKPNRREK